MENLNIAIVTDDKNYGKALGLAILNVCRTLVVNIFNRDEFATAQESYSLPDRDGRVFSGFDVILWEGELPEYHMGKSIIRIVDKPSLTCMNNSEDVHRVYKFSPAQRIVSELFEVYAKKTGRKPANIMRRGVHMYAFATWEGGSGCSTLAMAVAQELARFHDKKVLYLSLEELESTGNFMKVNPGNKTMGYYLYNLFKDRQMKGLVMRDVSGEFRPFMESYVMTDDFGVEAFRPTKGRNPLVDITPEEMGVFMESIMKTGRYDVVIVDAASGLSPATLTCLEMAERICLVGTPSINSDRQIHYIQYLMCIGGEDMTRKMIKVINKMPTNAREAFLMDYDGDDDSILDTMLRIEKGNILSNESGIGKILLEGNFGQRVNSLAELMVEPLM